MLPDGWEPAGPVTESGQAWVYQVRRTARSGFFALKRLKNPRRRGRFVREVETMSRLRADGLTCLPEIVERDLADERPYFVMPWYSGGSLQHYLETRESLEDPARALRLLYEV